MFAEKKNFDLLNNIIYAENEILCIFSARKFEGDISGVEALRLYSIDKINAV